MLQSLKLQNVGPAEEMNIEFTPRLNFITGDNGLGKTFLLDIAWWVLTGSWVSHPAKLRPSKNPVEFPIQARQTFASDVAYEHFAQYLTNFQTWLTGTQTFNMPEKVELSELASMVLNIRSDGSFAIWDRVRNSNKHLESQSDRPGVFLFSAEQVWDGLEINKRTFCNGLIRDWVSWQEGKKEAFEQLVGVLEKLSPSPSEPLTPGQPTRLSLDDVRDQPTLNMPYQQEVPLVHASAGIKRIVSLAYLLVWAWREHLQACKLLRTEPSTEIVFLVDEVESHLHPQWQRRIIPALMDVMGVITGEESVRIQLITTTHSPLVLASTETLFDEKKDCVWELELQKGEVVLEKYPWSKQGDVNHWLTSSVFDLVEPASLDAEIAIREAKHFLRLPSEQQSLETARELTEKLGLALPFTDSFLIRWQYFVDQLEEQQLSTGDE
jgi:hypothetical protein